MIERRDSGRQVSGRYRLVEPLGKGGMGEVWRAYDERLHRTVAVKRMRVPPGPEAERVSALAVREGRIAAKLQHPGAITVFDVIDDDGYPCLVMEYLPSTSLAEVLASSGPLSPEEAARIGAAVASGLAAAHDAGVVHRDVKPANVLLGEDGRIKITDFGISRLAADSSATATTTVRGTPAYLAPEVARGEVATFASDVFSLGATLYTVVEGEPPFGRDDNPIALLYRVSTGVFTNPARAGGLTPLLLRMLDQDPAARPTMVEVRDALSTFEADPIAFTPTAFTPTQQLEPVEPPRRKRSAIVLVALALLAGGTVAVLALVDSQGSGVAAPIASETSPPAATPPVTTPSGTAQSPTTTPQPPVITTVPPAEVPVVQSPGDPVAALTEYYALMPGGLDQGWARLTEKFQRNPAGGYEGYQRFWGSIKGVKISGVTPAGENTVTATIDYRFANGRNVREVHRYVLVNEGGQWKIDQSTVLSSRPA